MLITRMYCISKDPAMFITGSFYCICKTCLCSPFRNHPLSGSLMLHFCVFTSSGSSSDIESLSFPVPPDAGGWLSSFFFNGFFPCARRSFSISLFNSSSYQRACSCATRLRIFYCLHRLLHVLHPRRSVLYLQAYISYNLPESLKRSAQKGLYL